MHLSLLLSHVFALPSLVRREAGFHPFTSGAGSIFELSNGNTYTVNKTLGKGSFGIVYLGIPLAPTRGKKIAIKKIMLQTAPTPPKQATCLSVFCNIGPHTDVSSELDDEYPQRFTDQSLHPIVCEVKALEKLKRLVAPIETIGRMVYIPNKLIPGLPIDKYLKSKGRDARLYLGLVYVAAMDSLEELHKAGIFHGDSHPFNFLIKESKNGVIKVEWLDFGWSLLVPAPGIPTKCTMPHAPYKRYYNSDIKLFRDHFMKDVCVPYFPRSKRNPITLSECIMGGR